MIVHELMDPIVFGQSEPTAIITAWGMDSGWTGTDFPLGSNLLPN
jgi:hypothetical protein